jgi:hypothetical protein
MSQVGKGCGMRISTIICVALAAYGLSACVSVPSPKPPDPQRAHIGIALRIWAPIPFFPVEIESVYFARLEENQQDLLSQDPLIASNCNYLPDFFDIKGTYYLLNAEPGRYVAVVALQGQLSSPPPKGSSIPRVQCDLEETAARPPAIGPPVGGPQPHRTYTVFFPERLIRLTDVTATPGTMVFMGDYIVDTSVGLKDADEAQLHYAMGLDIAAPLKGLGYAIIMNVLTGGFQAYYRGSLREAHRDNQAEEQFFMKAKERLREAGWEAMLEQRLDSLKASQ